MPWSLTKWAATSSCVESGFDPHRATSAPPPFSVTARFAVSVVTCRQAETRRSAPWSSRDGFRRPRALRALHREPQVLDAIGLLPGEQLDFLVEVFVHEAALFGGP